MATQIKAMELEIFNLTKRVAHFRTGKRSEVVIIVGRVQKGRRRKEMGEQVVVFWAQVGNDMNTYPRCARKIPRTGPASVEAVGKRRQR